MATTVYMEILMVCCLQSIDELNFDDLQVKSYYVGVTEHVRFTCKQKTGVPF